MNDAPILPHNAELRLNFLIVCPIRHHAVQVIQAVKTRLASESKIGVSSHAGTETAPKKNSQARQSYIMQMALQGALDASKAVEAYAEDTGIIDRNGDPFRFSNDDIRAIGLTMFIEARKRAW